MTVGDLMKEIIFLSGIHGVGKGYIAKKIKKEINISIYEASDLIRLNGISTDEKKRTSNVKFNQELLINSINNLTCNGTFILNGHTCLLTSDDKIESIDINYFKKINIIGIISVYDDIDIIEDRLYKRDNIHFDKITLNNLQKVEIENTKQLSEKLCVPLLSFKNGDDIKTLIHFITNL